MAEKILILDCGSQVTRLIGRRLREMNVYCEIYPYDAFPEPDADVRGIIISGSPCSVLSPGAPRLDLEALRGRWPLLGICYGAQLLAACYGGAVEASPTREYGRATLQLSRSSRLFEGVDAISDVWMSHGDSITRLPEGAEAIARTVTRRDGAYVPNVENAAFRFRGEPTYGVQFHPEVYHTVKGAAILRNFAIGICGCKADWTPAGFIERSVSELRARIGDGQVILGLSGGVDSTVAAVLLHRAIGARLHCIFVDNGLLRKGEYASVLASYRDMGLNVRGVDAGELFLGALRGVTDPEAKRKAIGRLFVEVFQREAEKVEGARFLAQGTIYPDVIESAGVPGAAAKIKSHHNVGGLPERMHLEVVEPLRLLFKDEVRRVGRQLGIREELIGRHPFPGPSLAIRVLGEVTPAKLEILREADDVFIRSLRGWDCSAEELPDASDPSRKASNLYQAVWQAGVILLPAMSVGVMGDERSYERAVALRAVVSTDGMTADWFPFPHKFLAEVSDEIIRHVKGVNRVVYDISSKPPATIEWE